MVLAKAGGQLNVEQNTKLCPPSPIPPRCASCAARTFEKKMSITLREILTIYWPQAVLLLAAVGYLLKAVLDIRMKRIEIKQSLFQENRFKVINQFLHAYVRLQKIYREIMHGKKIEVDDVRSGFDDLYSEYFLLRMYLDPLEMVRYSDLITEMRSINARICETDIPSNQDKVNLENEISQFIEERLTVNNKNFKVIGELFREFSFKSQSLKR